MTGPAHRPEPQDGTPQRRAQPASSDPSGSPLHRFLSAADLDELAAAYSALPGPGAARPDTDPVVADLLASWAQTQALANLLMYPLVIAPEWRLSTLERALDDAAHGYLRLAAVVGVEQLDVAELPEPVRHRLIRALTALIESDEGVTADRSSATVIGLLRTTDAPDLVELLLHPSPCVRRNLQQGLFTVAGAAGLAALLDEPGFVDPNVQAAVHDQLAADGVDLSAAPDAQQRPLILSYLPALVEWDG